MNAAAHVQDGADDPRLGGGEGVRASGSRDRATPTSFAAGTVLGGTYSLLRRLDLGGMGVVFEAEHLRLRSFERCLGSGDRRIVPVADPERLRSLSPTQMFLLSRLEGGLSVEDALAVSGLPAFEARRVLADLLRAGLVRVL